MICPLLVIAYKDDPKQIERLAQCGESGCAWWEEGAGQCSVVSLLDELHSLRTAVLVIFGKQEMPANW
ncbi:hypothetical protein ES703_53223 [subsurface metagenome]